ncbi:MAG: hypothetical protein WCP62_17505, partial [Planctomycetota bacterium]
LGPRATAGEQMKVGDKMGFGQLHGLTLSVTNGEAEELTQRKSKTVDQGRCMYCFVLPLLRARAQSAAADGTRTRYRRPAV